MHVSTAVGSGSGACRADDCSSQILRAGGAEYLLPLNGDNVIGVVTTAVAEHEDTLLDIGRRYGVGYEEIIAPTWH
jgi:hypothetical protein